MTTAAVAVYCVRYVNDPDYVIASVGCGSNMGGFAFPWLADKLNGRDIQILAAEPTACPTLTQGEYRYDFPDAAGDLVHRGREVRGFRLGHRLDHDGRTAADWHPAHADLAL